MEISAKALDAIDQIIINDEGGWVYTNRKDDLGGPTYAGVTGKWFVIWNNKKYPNTKFSINNFISVFTQQKVNDYWVELIYEFYYDEFYLPIRGDDLPSLLAHAVLSAMINVGADEAPYWLQSAINDVGKEILKTPGTKFTFLKVDGKIGPKTIEAVNLIGMKYHHYVDLSNRYCLDYWLPKYIRKVVKTPSQRVNLKGWYNRVRKYIIT